MANNDLAKMTNRLDRLNAAILELEGEDVSNTAPRINWKGNLAEASLPDLDQMLDVFEGMIARLEVITHGEGVAQLGAQMKREGDERDPFEAYWEGRQHPRNGHVIESPVSKFDYSKSTTADRSSAVNDRNSDFWKKRGVRP